MLIEVSSAANDLRDDLLQLENDLEDGELMEERGRIAKEWKPRLDKMLLRISRTHEKAVQELQDVADKMDAKTMEGNQTSTTFDTAIENPKRMWDMGEFEDGGNAAKRARHEQQSIKSPSTPPHSEDSTVNPATVPTNPDGQPSNEKGVYMHADRKKLLLESIKAEDVEVNMGSIKMHPANANLLIGIGQKWKGAYLCEAIDMDEAAWLKPLKQFWDRGGWENRKQWLKAVMQEYRHHKADPSPEAETQIRVLSCCIRAGRYYKGDYPLV